MYGPVHSWRSGTSLGIDPIGETSTCSFNCTYCQLGSIQNITNEVKVYVPTGYIVEDLNDLEAKGIFSYEDLDVITFAGSGEPSLAANLDEMIKAIRELMAFKKNVPISILTNATMLNNAEVRARVALADQVSVKLDAPNDQYLKMINQPAAGINIDSIVSGIKALKKEFSAKLQLQMMFMPKYIKNSEHFIKELAELIIQTGIESVQINTPTRPRPVNDTYHIETRGNHYADKTKENTADYKLIELPVISQEEAFNIEDKLKDYVLNGINGHKLNKLEVINVYKR